MKRAKEVSIITMRSVRRKVKGLRENGEMKRMMMEEVDGEKHGSSEEEDGVGDEEEEDECMEG